MKKKIFTIGICLLCVCGCGKVSKLKNGEEAVVSFKENEKISADSLYTNLKESYGVYALVEMIDNYVLYDKYGEVNDDMKEYAESYIKYIKNYYPEEADYLSYIQTNFGSENEEEFKEYIYLNYLRNKATEDYAKSLIKESAIEDYYKNKAVGDIQASHILISAKITEDMTDEEIAEAEKKAKETAESLIAQLKKSDDVETLFASLAKENSDDEGSAKNGGDVGYFNKIGETTMTEAFATAAYKLKDGEYTKTPVKSEYGYHIILRTASKDKASYKDYKDTILEVLANEELNNNKTISIDAMTNLRDSYDMKIEDDGLKSQYANYIQYLISQTETNTNNQ